MDESTAQSSRHGDVAPIDFLAALERERLRRLGMTREELRAEHCNIVKDYDEWWAQRRMDSNSEE